MSDIVKIAIDAMGGDGSPKKIIDGILHHHKNDKETFTLKNVPTYAKVGMERCFSSFQHLEGADSQSSASSACRSDGHTAQHHAQTCRLCPRLETSCEFIIATRQSCLHSPGSISSDCAFARFPGL